MTEKPYIPRLYGRRQDRPLRQRPARLVEELLPRIAMPDPEQGAIAPSVLFTGLKKFWLEIGFGGGEHLAWQAEQNPGIGMIGAEPFINGVAKLLTQVDARKLDNVRIHFGDARPLLEAIASASLDRIFVLYPDPWPKARHFKRRIISPWFLAEAARVLRPGGALRVASDIPDYIRWTLMHASQNADFEWTATTPADWRDPPADWRETRYEKKARAAGRTPTYLTFSRR